MRPLDELLDAAKSGKLTEEELDYVGNRLKESLNKEDPNLYTLIHIVGKAGATQYREIVEHFLYYQSDPMIAKIAFNTLVNYWDLIDEYLKEIKQFMKGVSWDNHEYIRFSAIAAAGRYLTGYDDKELLEELLRIVLDEKEDDGMRWCAYESLADAVDRDFREIIGKELDPSVVWEARAKLERIVNQSKEQL